MTDAYGDEQRERIQHVALNEGFFRALRLAHGSQQKRPASPKAEAERLRAEVGGMGATLSQIEVAIFDILSSTSATQSDDETNLTTLEQHLRQLRAPRSRMASRIDDLETEAERVRTELNEMDAVISQTEAVMFRILYVRRGAVGRPAFGRRD